MKKAVLIGAGILILVSIAINASIPTIKKTILTGMEQGKITMKSNTSPKNKEDEIEKAVKSVIDDKHLKEFSVIPLEDGKFNVTVAFYVDDSQDLAASAVKLKTTEVFASLFINDVGVNEVWAFAWYPYQSSDAQMVLKSKMNKELADKAEHSSKMTFQYDAERLMIIEKSSYTELPVSVVTP